MGKSQFLYSPHRNIPPLEPYRTENFVYVEYVKLYFPLCDVNSNSNTIRIKYTKYSRFKNLIFFISLGEGQEKNSF
jgi:hypothetical protein